MYKLFLFLIAFGLMVIGFTYIITYMNLMTMGYSFLEYLKFIFSRIECLFSIIGLIIISIIIFTKGSETYDIHI